VLQDVSQAFTEGEQLRGGGVRRRAGGKLRRRRG
jgi:hypothetical protein